MTELSSSSNHGPTSAPLSTGAPRLPHRQYHHHHHHHNNPSSRLLDALSHPAQAAAAAAHAHISQPPTRRGRKRKTASLVVLSIMCIAVVKYSGSMYDYDDYFNQQQQQNNNNNNNNKRDTSNGGRRNQLRSTAFTKPITATISNNPIRIQSGATTKQQQHHQQQQQYSSSSSDNNRQFIIRKRIVHAIRAAFVADAAGMGTHWIYDMAQLERTLQSRTEPEFRSPPVPNFYSSKEYPGHYREGQSSPYGEQLLMVTQYAASLGQQLLQKQQQMTRKGRQQQRETGEEEEEEVSTDEESSYNYDTVDPGSILEPMSDAFEEWAEHFGGRPDQATLSFRTCRREQRERAVARKMALPHVDDKVIDDDDGSGGGGGGGGTADREDDDFQSCGAPDDDQAHFFVKIVPMTCLFLGHKHRRHYVEQAIRVHQNNDQAVMFGLALSNLLERVLLMDTTSDDEASTGQITSNFQKSVASNDDETSTTSAARPVKSLGEALDTTLRTLQDDHSEEGWFHFAVSLTSHHQQMETLLQAWSRARDAAEHNTSLEQAAAQFGRSCHMPGALIVSLEALYKATMTESIQKQGTNYNDEDANGKAQDDTKKVTSPLTHVYKGYNYYVKALLGTMHLADSTTTPAKENTMLVSAVRENILAGGDTCSRSILIGAVLGAAYGAPPVEWWEKLYPVLSGQIDEAAYAIADFASTRFQG